MWIKASDLIATRALTAYAIADCDPFGIQNDGKIRKRKVPCGEKAPSVKPQNIPEAESGQAAIARSTPPQTSPGILRYHPDIVPSSLVLLAILWTSKGTVSSISLVQ